jgi:MYXO-CTERM domain-containing protein
LDPQPAEACGGCFVPPEENSQVTGHRMVLSVSKTQTTLYDQIEYSGEPESFAWVLPTQGIVDIGLAPDLFFNQLGQDTAVFVQPPPINCPSPGCGGELAADGSGSATGAGGGGPGGGVTVLESKTVGPYETVQLDADTPDALKGWLKEHGYKIPADIEPVINGYLAEGFNFLAMKLVPGVGIDKMQPVSISTKGASPVLPLRMVAAGTGQKTLVTLFVIGEGRYEPQNFPAFSIPAAGVVWNWDKGESNYSELRDVAYDASGGFAWQTESSVQYYPSNFRGQMEQIIWFNGPDAAGYAGLTEDEAIAQMNKDVDRLFAGMHEASVRVTRLRAELSRAALATDLVVGASDDQDLLSNFIQVTKSVGTPPPCPPPPDCGDSDDDDGFGSGIGFPGFDGDDDGGGLRSGKGGCNVHGTPHDGFGVLLAGALGLALLHARRRRSRCQRSA